MVRLKGAGYYAVARGKHVGIYHSWSDCEKQVKGFPNAKFKKFPTEHEANAYIETHRARDGGYSYSMNPASLSSPYSRQQQNPSQDPHDLTGLDNMAATALMSLFARPSTSTSSSPTLPYAAPFATVQRSKINLMDTRRRGSQAEDEDEDTLLEAFRIFDRDNKGFIDRWDILRVVRMLGERLSRREIQAMMAEADRDNNGRVEFAEFAAMLQMEKEEGEEEERRSSISFTDAPVVYTDGACSKNGRANAKAGWGVWWGDQHKDNSFGAVNGEQTNNRAELLAVIKAIDTAQAQNLTKLIIRTDSQLLINSMDKWIIKWRNNGWKTAENKDVKNQDLLQVLDHQLEQFPVHFEHVPGHAGVHGNEMADQLARHAASEVAAGRLRFTPSASN